MKNHNKVTIKILVVEVDVYDIDTVIKIVMIRCLE